MQKTELINLSKENNKLKHDKRHFERAKLKEKTKTDKQQQELIETLYK